MNIDLSKAGHGQWVAPSGRIRLEFDASSALKNVKWEKRWNAEEAFSFEKAFNSAMAGEALRLEDVPVI